MSKKAFSPFYLFRPIGDFLFLILLSVTLLFFNYKGLGLSISAFIKIGFSFYKDFILFFGLWYLLSGYTKIYSNLNSANFINLLKNIVFQLILFSLTILAFFNNDKGFFPLQTKQQFLTLFILAIYGFSSRLLYIKIFQYRIKKGKDQMHTIIIGINKNSNELISLLKTNKQFSRNIRMIFTNSNMTDQKLPIENLQNYITENSVEYAYISLNGELSDVQVDKIVRFLEEKYIEFGFITKNVLEIRQNLEINYLDSFPILTYKKYPLDHTFNQIIKRTFDIIFTLTVFVFLLSWLLPIIALAVYFSQGGPILFAQKRNGLNGKEFNCLKFRTMRPDKDNNKKPTERDDPRVTKLGKILRKTSLDELPQFFNVLKGEMSIVGPRPHMVSENEAYSEIINRYALRHYVKPGITGLAQVRGHRGAVDSHKDMEMRIRTDIYYVRNWSFLLDLLIIYQTAKLMVFGDENAI